MIVCFKMDATEILLFIVCGPFLAIAYNQLFKSHVFDIKLMQNGSLIFIQLIIDDMQSFSCRTLNIDTFL